MEMMILNSFMVILLCSNGFLAGTLVTIFIMRKGFSKYVVKSNAELEKRNRVIRNQKDLIKQMQSEGTVKVEVTQANEDLDFPKG